MNPCFPRSAAGAAALLFIHAAIAQAPGTLGEVTVTANPLGAPDLIAPASRLAGPALLLRAQPSLGETLSTTPGVSSTYFGPQASRPVIRGLDGDRIRILNNGGASVDASGLSYDHAVALDPIAVDSIEVLRGPGALLYGGNAIGGVVNVIDNRIPREPLQGLAGRVDASLASGNRERAGAALVEAGNERFGLHVDAFGRRSQDTRVPTELPCTRDGTTSFARRLCNSDAQTRGAAVGGSAFFDRGFLGASVVDFGSEYGSVAEDEVRIDMRSRRLGLEGQWRPVGGPLQSLKAQAGHTAYRHTEFDAGAPGTEFRNRGSDWRLEARHLPIGRLDGVIGLQGEHTRFSAQGDEAFAPPSRTRQQAVFVHEELRTAWGKLSAGLRSESVRVESLGSAQLPRFAPASRSYRPGSYALGALWNLAPRWQVTANLAHSERAPKDYELFADGPHVATGAYEVGNANLGKERSQNADLGVQWSSGPHRVKLNAYQSQFRNYVALLSTGLARDAAGNGAGTGTIDCGDGSSVESGCSEELLPEFAYTPVRAQFRGLEASGVLRLLPGERVVDLEWRGDLVRATNRSSGEPLPRIAPARAGATLVGTSGPWSARVGFDRAARQDRVPTGELATPGYTLWHAALTYRMKAGPGSLLWYTRLENAGNTLATSASSILTQTAPGRVPLPGRSVRLGVQASF